MATDDMSAGPTSGNDSANGGLSRRGFLKGSAAAGAVLGPGAGLAPGARATPRRARGSRAAREDAPNVVVIMADQHRADLSAREGFALDTTPFTDQLAAEGVWFDRAYTTAPLCCPARASLLTGRYPTAHRVRENPAVDEAVFDTDLPGLLREAGYSTALVGKNHSYLTDTDLDWYRPYGHTGAQHEDTTTEQRRFDQWLAGLRHDTSLEPTPFPAEMQCPYRIVTDATGWIDSIAGNPFFLWLSFAEPHNPYQVSDPYFSMFPPEQIPPPRYGPEILQQLPFAWQYLRRLGETGDPDYGASIPRARSNYLGMLRLIDDQVRRFVNFLAHRGLRNRTIVVITADHGDYFGEYGLVRKGAGVPEVLSRIPLLITGPDITKHHGPHPAHVSLADIFPTVCETIGTALPAGVQGRSLWPMLTGQHYPTEEFSSAYVEQGIGELPYTPTDVPHPLPGGPTDTSNFDELNAVTQSGQHRMVRSGDWKLVADNLGTTRLHHLPTDPYEIHDLSHTGEHADRYTALMRELLTWEQRVHDPLPVPPNGYARKTDAHNYLAPYRPHHHS